MRSYLSCHRSLEQFAPCPRRTRSIWSSSGRPLDLWPGVRSPSAESSGFYRPASPNAAAISARAFTTRSSLSPSGSTVRASSSSCLH
jgi:hypothetical protein